MIRKTPKPKALLFRAKYGENPPPKVRKPVRRVSKKYASRKTEYRALAKSWLKDRPCKCQDIRDSTSAFICGDYRFHLAEEIHHQRGRGRGGRGPLLTDVRYFLGVCGRSHKWIHDNIESARYLGLICQEGDWNKPIKP